MPVPMSVRFNEGRMPITKAFTVATRGHADDRLRAYIDRMARWLKGRTVMEFSRGLAADVSRALLIIECQSAGKTVPALDENESYSLDISNTQATLNAPAAVGAMPGWSMNR